MTINFDTSIKFTDMRKGLKIFRKKLKWLIFYKNGIKDILTNIETSLRLTPLK